jgi:hypothetical protein
MPLETEARSKVGCLPEADGWRVFDVVQTNINTACFPSNSATILPIICFIRMERWSA